MPELEAGNITSDIRGVSSSGTSDKSYKEFLEILYSSNSSKSTPIKSKMPELEIGNVASGDRAVCPEQKPREASDDTPEELKTSGDRDESGIDDIAPEMGVPSERYGLEIGNTAPDFCLKCTEGRSTKLSDFRGTKVMLCFYRFVNCPYTACALKKLMGAHKLLAWAAKLKVITIFYTDNGIMIKGISDPNAPIQTLWRKDNPETPFKEYAYPFVPLADKKGTAFSMYNVKTSSFPALLGATAIHACELLRAMTLRGALAAPRELQYGGLRSLHTEFLINEDGEIVDAFRAKAPKDSMEIERITKFLLQPQKRPPGARRSRRKTQ